LQNKIKILGKLSKNSVPYNKVDLVFNSSRSEGSSNSILESLSFGTPVVASKNSGNSFILKNKTFGRLFDLESINTAIEAIKYFYFLDQEKLSEISHEAINYIKNDYNKSKMIDGYSKYFTKAINV
jgi:glycosyltransferase involved in cell wall biosynthesis